MGELRWSCSAIRQFWLAVFGSADIQGLRISWVSLQLPSVRFIPHEFSHDFRFGSL